MEIGPRFEEHENQMQHFWTRRINGTPYFFLHVKVSRTQPRIVVMREDEDGGAVDVHRFAA